MDELGIYDEDMSGLGAKGAMRIRKPGVDYLDFIFYDTQQVAATGTTLLTYFTTPYGGSKTKLKTNMAAAGYITNALEFHLKSIAVGNVTAAVAATSVQDLQLAVMAGYLELVIQDKIWFQAPISKLPYGGGLWLGSGAASPVSYYPQLGSPDRTGGYKLRHTIVIPKNVNFYVSLVWPTSPTITQAQDLVVTLEGTLVRPGK